VLPYVRERRQFGQPIGTFELMQAKLADMYAALNACRAYVYSVARACDAGTVRRRDAASCILFAAERATQVALEAIQAVDLFLTTTLGADNTISFEVLEKTLQKMIADVQSYLPGSTAESSTNQTSGTAQTAADQVDGIPVSGSIRSREQVVRAIDSICEYYRQVEPCSPVPFLLRRAQKLAVMDFVQALQELNLATVEALRPSMGSAVNPATPPETTGS